MEKNYLNAEIKLIDNGLKFQTKTGNNPEIITDYIPPLGNGEGYMPLELFLISFGTCISGVVLPMLRKMQKNIEEYSVKIAGIRKTEHPTGFNKIILDIFIKSKDITKEEIEKIIKMAETTYCPIWSMLKSDIEIETNVFIK
ncbi:MAG: OsmC family protein [Bacteroidales bacterium]|jgi:putative redox protein|nr:OsmC family protein [Bacteroidales bacterium]